MKWDYRSFKCSTPASVKDKMVEMREEGWEFQIVYKVQDGFVLQVKKRKDAQ